MKIARNQIQGVVGTLLVHVAIVVLLLVVFLRSPQRMEESGVPVMLGNVDLAKGVSQSYQMTEVKVQSPTVPQEVKALENTAPAEPEEPTVTQTMEETVAVEPTEKTEAEKRAEAEKQAAELVNQQMANAFGKGSEMGSSGTSEVVNAGTQGNTAGSALAEKAEGQGVQGTFDLNGRNIAGDGLPMPVNNVQDEGRVVVTITVNPDGEVVATSINKRTNTVNAELRDAAEKAARKARFNKVNGVNNQTGTITYYFKLK